MLLSSAVDMVKGHRPIALRILPSTISLARGRRPSTLIGRGIWMDKVLAVTSSRKWILVLNVWDTRQPLSGRLNTNRVCQLSYYDCSPPLSHL